MSSHFLMLEEKSVEWSFWLSVAIFPSLILWALWSCLHQKCIPWYYYQLKVDSKAQFVHILSTHVLIMALPWWLDVSHFSVCSHSVNPCLNNGLAVVTGCHSFLFSFLSDLTVPYESRISTLQRTTYLCSRPVQTMLQYGSWFHSKRPKKCSLLLNIMMYLRPFWKVIDLSDSADSHFSFFANFLTCIHIES